MDNLISTILGAVGGFVGGIAAHFIAHDAYEVAPRYARELIDRAVARLPEADRERFAEQWLADLYEHEGVIAKFKHAIGCVLAARKVGEIYDAQPETVIIRGNGAELGRVNPVAIFLLREFHKIEELQGDQSLTNDQFVAAISKVQREHPECPKLERSDLVGKRDMLSFMLPQKVKCGIKAHGRSYIIDLTGDGPRGA
jgi:hypothetical protein